MRISQNSVFIPYLRNLENIQDRRTGSDLRIATGEDILTIADDPKRLVGSKQMTDTIDRNESYLNNIESGLTELRTSEEQLQSISDTMQEIRQMGLEGTQIGNHENLYSIGLYIKGMIEDIVKNLNYDINGHYVFSGTKTTEKSIDKAEDEKTNLPFELVEGEPTEDNPSGLEVRFKGNNKDRVINKDSISTEVINIKADSLLGEGGQKGFEAMIDLFNLFSYGPDGNLRKRMDLFTKEEVGKLNLYQADIGNTIDTFAKVISQNGGIQNRLTAVSDQIKTEQIRLGEFRSLMTDTDIAKTSIELKKEEAALTYTLQVGSRLIQTSLFDFLG